MNANLLKGEIRKHGYTQADVAAKIGISLSRFNAKINSFNGSEFTLAETKALKVLFNLTPEQTDAIFFS